MSKAQKSTNISEVIKQRKSSLAIRTGYWRLFQRLLLLAVIVYLLFTQLFLITRASGNEMFPAIKDGDLIIGFRLQKEYTKNDVVIYEENGNRNVGRITARENDVVTIDESGTLLVNGTVQTGEIMFPTNAKEGIKYPYRVPKDSIFVLGDYRIQAQDSREFGPILMNAVEGKVITILRRRSL